MNFNLHTAPHRLGTRWAALTLSALMTLGMLAGVDSLARWEPAGAQLAHQSQPTPPAQPAPPTPHTPRA